MAKVGIVGSTGRVGNLLIDALMEDAELWERYMCSVS